MDDLYNNFLVGKFDKTLFYCFHRTLYIRFYDDIQLFDITRLDL